MQVIGHPVTDSDDEFELAVQEFGLPNLSTELEELTAADIDSCMTFPSSENVSAANVFMAASSSQPVPDASRESVPQTSHSQPEPVVGLQLTREIPSNEAPLLVWVKLRFSSLASKGF